MSSQDKNYPLTWEQAVAWLRGQPGQEELVKACFFDDPLKEAADRFYQSEEWRETDKLLPIPHSGFILDLGAGRGISSYALAKKGWKVIALEPDPSPLVGNGAIRELIETSGLDIQVSGECGEKMPFEDNYFDAIYCRQALHHSKSLPGTCGEVARVLKPGGIFIATREHVVDHPNDMQLFLKNHTLHHLYGGENAFSLPQYINAMEDAGFLFKKILTPYDNPINYFPVTQIQAIEQLNALWKWRYQPTSEELLQNARRSNSIPGRLYTFIVVKPKIETDRQYATDMRSHSWQVSQRALTDNIYSWLNRLQTVIERNIAQNK